MTSTIGIPIKLLNEAQVCRCVSFRGHQLLLLKSAVPAIECCGFSLRVLLPFPVLQLGFG
jgi:hypothetical protein